MTMNISPKDKAIIHGMIEVTGQERLERAWSFWLIVAALSLAALCCFNYDFIPVLVRFALAGFAFVGYFLFLGFLATVPFDQSCHGDSVWWGKQ